MAASCIRCGERIGFRRRLAGDLLCEKHEAEERAQQEAQMQQLATAAGDYVNKAMNVTSAGDGANQLMAFAESAHLAEIDRKRLNVEAVSRLVETVLDDAHLSEDEEIRLDHVVRTLGLTQDDVVQAVGSRANELLIARINAGRLPAVANPAIFLKTGEVMHLEVEAALLKEVVRRETRGGYSGFSVPIAKGIRYRVGGYSGRSVVVGTSIEVADTGLLCISSQRAVFKGARSSVECLFAKLVGINVFDDGIQFHVSNRKTATLVRVGDGHLAGAVVNAIVGRQS